MKYNQLLRIALIALVIPAVYFSCSKSGSKPSTKIVESPLAITAISTTEGPFNTSVIITGTGFSTTIANDQVLFNGKTAVINTASPKQLTASVPLERAPVMYRLLLTEKPRPDLFLLISYLPS